MQNKNTCKKQVNKRLNRVVSNQYDSANLPHNDSVDIDMNGKQTYWENKISIKPRQFFQTVIDFGISKKLFISILLIVSILIHCLVIENIHDLSQQKTTLIEKDPDKLTFKIDSQIKEPLTELKKAKKIEAIPEIQPAKHKKSARKKIEKSRKKKKSVKELEMIGKTQINKLKQGKFPALILSYNDPVLYIHEMYNLGAKTLIYNVQNREYYQIDLLKGDIIPFTRGNLHKFSPLKRVINDSQWNKQINQAGMNLNGAIGSLELLLLVPVQMEARWMGYMIQEFQQMKINVHQVQSVGAQFHHSKLKLLNAHLKNGITKQFQNQSGV